MSSVDLEKIWEKFGNKYLFLALASKEARKLLEKISKGEIEAPEDVYKLALEKTLREGPKEEEK